ncbi:MAG: helix-turn-helix domain-containing protein [Planctomycetales bacterium]|nr:helix-turn-helix domain-containing protein [Planctomycetales bacterium]
MLSRLGERVRARRKALGWTAREAARRAGLSPRFLADIEAGRGNVSVRNLARLAGALGTSAGTLLAPEGIRHRMAARLDEMSEAELSSIAGALRPGPDGTRVVALLGLRGAGKSTVGPRLARALGGSFHELDALIEERAGMRLGQLFSLHGEAHFRDLEHRVLDGFLAEARARAAPTVLATGGSLVTAPETYALLRRRAFTVWLKARPEDHWSRVVAQGDIRPMKGRRRAKEELRQLLARREPLYAMADLTVDTSATTPAAAADAIRRACARESSRLPAGYRG